MFENHIFLDEIFCKWEREQKNDRNENWNEFPCWIAFCSGQSESFSFIFVVKCMLINRLNLSRWGRVYLFLECWCYWNDFIRFLWEYKTIDEYFDVHLIYIHIYFHWNDQILLHTKQIHIINNSISSTFFLLLSSRCVELNFNENLNQAWNINALNVSIGTLKRFITLYLISFITIFVHSQ